MTPNYEELLEGATQWRKSHKGVNILLSHHGFRKEGYEGEYYETGHPGTWCYYLLIPEQMFPHRWSDFACVRSDSGFENPGPAWSHEWFDSEITWASSEPQYCRQTGRVWDAVKVGCDYGHAWHRVMGYPDTYKSVTEDALKTAEAFIRANPDRLMQSGWSNVWDKADAFYTAINGRLVHPTDKIPENYKKWGPAATPPNKKDEGHG